MSTNVTTVRYDIDLDPFSHTWSLGVEEQFYLIFPALILLAYGSRVVECNEVDPQQNKTLCCFKKKSLWSGTVLMVPTLLSFGLSWWWSQLHSTWAFYLLPSRFWQMASGSLLHWSHETNKHFWQKHAGSRIVRFLLDITAAVLFGLSLALTEPSKNFPLPFSLLAVSGTLVFITVGYLVHLSQQPAAQTTSLTSPLHFLLSTTCCAYIGRLSYAWYLWHWPVFVCFRLTSNLDRWGVKIAACVISIALSVANYYAIEYPIKLWKTKGNRAVFLWAAAGILVAGSLLLVLLFSIDESSSTQNTTDTTTTQNTTDNGVGTSTGTIYNVTQAITFSTLDSSSYSGTLKTNYEKGYGVAVGACTSPCSLYDTGTSIDSSVTSRRAATVNFTTSLTSAVSDISAYTVGCSGSCNTNTLATASCG
jgi:peptidoglycan/LPS O-acetylase OafA/YrhL